MKPLVAATLAVLIGLMGASIGIGTSRTYIDPQADLPPIPGEPPFQLPLAGDPGPGTWMMVQWYGNTVLSYEYRDVWYEAGQGMHFGIDFAARCGTPVYAIGAGEVVKTDAQEHGAGPHNLLIRHDNGFVSLYGHLVEPPLAFRGMPVEAGQLIGYTGDPDLTCTSRPHLHLEIRTADYAYAYNPIPFIDADWDSLALFGPRDGFQRDLAHVHQWDDPYDQPIVDFWGPMLNDYDQTWPPYRWE